MLRNNILAFIFHTFLMIAWFTIVLTFFWALFEQPNEIGISSSYIIALALENFFGRFILKNKGGIGENLASVACVLLIGFIGSVIFSTWTGIGGTEFFAFGGILPCLAMGFGIRKNNNIEVN
ncbi:MAG TPA: hypothetical protein VIM51_04200 [Desulfosporosinus sp.]